MVKNPTTAQEQYDLGLAYLNGNGVRMNQAWAFKWFLKAADQGHAAAQYKVACAYEEGRGVDKDYAESLKWCRKAAEQGHRWAQYQVAGAYTYGRGVDKDLNEAAKWYNLTFRHTECKDGEVSTINTKKEGAQ